MKYLLFFLLLPFLAAAQPAEPMLTLNTDMHTARINRISTDARGRYLLTASLDKSAKLWNLQNGALLRTFRIPLGAGNEGKLSACALSPDGKVAAMGGWTGYAWDNKIYIYLFNTFTGEMLRRIGDLPNVINDLEFSPDGRFLVAALGGSNGIRVFRSADGVLQAEGKDYGAGSYNVAFNTWGDRMASVCEDGYLRLYDADFKLLKKTKTDAGSRPFSLAFSPDGRLLALGYDDSPTVQVLDAGTLKLLYQPDVTDATTIDNRLEILAFSSDGTRLYGGGFYSKYENGEWWRYIRCWAEAGKAGYTDIAAGQNTIMDLKALPNGSIVYGGFQPDWGVINAENRRELYVGPETQDYAANDQSHFRLGPGGRETGITPFGKNPLRFELVGRRLSETASTQPGPSTEGSGLALSDWLNSPSPKLNGKALGFLKQYEQSRSAAAAKSGAGFVLGTSWNLYCADAAGVLRWQQPAPTTTWCVNIDPENQLAAAAFADGTIRWYRFRDGRPLLSLYIHPDRKRWILWTPGGYFDCAPGAEELLGWHVNRGADRAADYFPLSQFRDRFYRPDVIDRVLETLDEETALQDADAARGKTSSRRVTALDELPPTARILAPAEGTELRNRQITLAYSLQSTDNEPITAVRILIDGRPIATGRGFKPTGTRLEEPVQVPEADCTVSVVAENRFGASLPATIHLYWKGATAPGSGGIDIRPKLYVLAIGVSNYQNADINKLSYADDDARDFAALMLKQKDKLYRDVEAKVLLDAAATKEAVLDGLDWLEKETTSRDVAMLFFAGHGVDDRNGNFYYLPVNADFNLLKRTGVARGDIQTTVSSVAGKFIVFLDACHSGSVMQPFSTTRGEPLPEIVPVINELASAENGSVVFCSTTNRQSALEGDEWGHGAFTKAILEGLGGKAFSPGTKKITLKTLDAYVAERVKELTGKRQTPTTVYPPNVPDFPIGYGN